MAEPDWLELAWKLSGSGMSKTRFAEVYADKIDKVPAGSHSAKAAVAALAPAPDQTNAEVSDERLRELLPCPFCDGEAILLKDHKKLGLYIACTVCSCCTITGTRTEVTAIWNRRSVTSQASEGETNLLDDVWQKLLDKDDRTSPEEYPDMVLITREELASVIVAAASTVSKRVERLETINECMKAVETERDQHRIIDDYSEGKRSAFNRAIIALQALGGRS